MSFINLIRIDSLCFLFFISVIIYLYYFSNGPHKNGFFVTDVTLKHPYNPINVTVGQIMTFSLLVPPLVIVWSEGGAYFPSMRMIKRYTFTFFCNLIVTLFFKFTVGRLRPHFWAVCKPIFSANLGDGSIISSGQSSYHSDESGREIDGATSDSIPGFPYGKTIFPSLPSLPGNLNLRDDFITNYTCANGNIRQVNETRQSFYSGHASIAFSTAVWLVLYIQYKYVKTGNSGATSGESRSLVKPTIQIIILLAGFYPGITQVTNHWHHPTDVMTGYLMGGLVSYFNYYFVN